MRSFSDRLLAWHDEHGRRDLPWQHPRTPYRVWISEIMLQQTRVSTVIPYFERWVQAFPDIDTLARATQDDVLAHWSGLGYYARARNIHEAARICVAEHAGELPGSPEGLAALPGIGPSTANAIVSQSTDRPAAVLDGNVKRVLARHTATRGWTGSTAVQKILWKAAEDRLPDSRGADYTQAVMDLGALVCRRGAADCISCPVSEDCVAYTKNQVTELPSPKPRTRVAEKDLYMLIVRDGDGRVLLEKRPGAGIWGGLWCLPAGDSRKVPDLAVGPAKDLPAFEHRLSHLKLTIRPILTAPGDPTQVQCTPERNWFTPGQRGSLGLPKPVTDLLVRLDNGEFE